MGIDSNEATLSRDGAEPVRKWRAHTKLGSVRGMLPLVLVAAGFVVAEFAFVVYKRALNWDEIVYISQINRFAFAAPFVAARARGVTLLTAPVTVLTSSVLALRAYLAIASGLALLGALWLWRRTLPSGLLAIAGLLLGSLWIVQYSGPRATPNIWVALSGLASVGLFIIAARTRRKRYLAGLAACLAVATLMRPSDAVFLAAPMIGAAVFVRVWRDWRLVVSLLAGLAAGGLEWVIEAYVRWGGIGHRLNYATAMQGGAGLHAGAWDELRALDGPVICRRNCTAGWDDPKMTIWWLALPLLVALGLLAARRAGRLSTAVLATTVGFSLSVQYLFLINYSAPRFLIPAYALFSLPVAEGACWLLARSRASSRIAAAAVCVALLGAQAFSQHLVLTHNLAPARHPDTGIANRLIRAGVRPPCVIQGYQFIPLAYYTDCRSTTPVAVAVASSDTTIAVVAKSGSAVPSYARTWQIVRLPGTGVVAFVRRG